MQAPGLPPDWTQHIPPELLQRCNQAGYLELKDALVRFVWCRLPLRRCSMRHARPSRALYTSLVSWVVNEAQGGVQVAQALQGSLADLRQHSERSRRAGRRSRRPWCPRACCYEAARRSRSCPAGHSLLGFQRRHGHALQRADLCCGHHAQGPAGPGPQHLVCTFSQDEGSSRAWLQPGTALQSASAGLPASAVLPALQWYCKPHLHAHLP